MLVKEIDMSTFVVTTSATGIVECAKNITPILNTEGAFIKDVDLKLDTDSLDLTVTDSAGHPFTASVKMDKFALASTIPTKCEFNPTSGNMEFKNSAGTVLFSCALAVKVCTP